MRVTVTTPRGPQNPLCDQVARGQGNHVDSVRTPFAELSACICHKI